jgi:hypothetical protein
MTSKQHSIELWPLVKILHYPALRRPIRFVNVVISRRSQESTSSDNNQSSPTVAGSLCIKSLTFIVGEHADINELNSSCARSLDEKSSRMAYGVSTV